MLLCVDSSVWQACHSCAACLGHGRGRARHWCKICIWCKPVCIHLVAVPVAGVVGPAFQDQPVLKRDLPVHLLPHLPTFSPDSACRVWAPASPACRAASSTSAWECGGWAGGCTALLGTHATADLLGSLACMRQLRLGGETERAAHVQHLCVLACAAHQRALAGYRPMCALPNCASVMQLNCFPLPQVCVHHLLPRAAGGLDRRPGRAQVGERGAGRCWAVLCLPWSHAPQPGFL